MVSAHGSLHDTELTCPRLKSSQASFTLRCSQTRLCYRPTLFDPEMGNTTDASRRAGDTPGEALTDSAFYQQENDLRSIYGTSSVGKSALIVSPDATHVSTTPPSPEPADVVKMADPFEVRMRFTSQLQHLNASVTSAQKAAQFALKYKDMGEDLHSCILEQLERVSSTSRSLGLA